MCVVIPLILHVRIVDVPGGVTQEEGHTGFLHPPSAVLALIFIERRIQPFLALVDREVDFVGVCVFIKLHITAQSGPVILVILCHSH